jgi:hypothetical protein
MERQHNGLHGFCKSYYVCYKTLHQHQPSDVQLCSRPNHICSKTPYCLCHLDERGLSNARPPYPASPGDGMKSLKVVTQSSNITSAIYISEASQEKALH